MSPYVEECRAKYGVPPKHVNAQRRRSGITTAYYWYPKRGTKEARWYRAQWCRMPGDPSTTEFWMRYAQLVAAIDNPSYLAAAARALLRVRLRLLHESSKRRAAEKKLGHEVSLDDVIELYERQGGRCAVSGLQFHFNGVDGTMFSRAFAPSLDRLNNAKGYTFENVRLVCRIANFAMGTWGQKALEELAIGIVERAGREPVCNASDEVLRKA